MQDCVHKIQNRKIFSAPFLLCLINFMKHMIPEEIGCDLYGGSHKPSPEALGELRSKKGSIDRKVKHLFFVPSITVHLYAHVGPVGVFQPFAQLGQFG